MSRLRSRSLLFFALRGERLRDLERFGVRERRGVRDLRFPLRADLLLEREDRNLRGERLFDLRLDLLRDLERRVARYVFGVRDLDLCRDLDLRCSLRRLSLDLDRERLDTRRERERERLRDLDRLDLERDRLFERDRERRDLDRLRERDLRLEWDRLRDRERDDRLCRDLDLDLKRCFSNSGSTAAAIRECASFTFLIASSISREFTVAFGCGGFTMAVVEWHTLRGRPLNMTPL